MPILKKNSQLKASNNKKKMMKLLNVDQKKAMELLNINQNKAAKLLKKDQIKAAKLLIVKESRQSRSGPGKKKVAKLLLEEQKKAARLLEQEQVQAAEVLQMIQRVVENSNDAIIGTTLDGIITSWNGGAVKMFGYYPNEVIGKSGSTLFPPEMWAKVPALLDKIKAREAVSDYDISGLRKDGTRFDMAISISPIITKNGKVVGASVVERDITERKKASIDLMKLRKAIDGSGEVIFMTDKEGIFTFVNPGFTTAYGYTSIEVINKVTPRILKSGLMSTENYKIFWNTILSGKEIKGEFKNKRKDGTIFDVEGSVNAIFDENNNIIGFLGIQRDITEHKKAEREVLKTKNFLNNIINASGDPFFVKDKDSKFVFANDASYKLFGTNSENTIGKTLGESLDADQMTGFLRIDKMVLTTGEKNITEEKLTPLNGVEPMTIITTKSRYIDTDGNKFLIGIIHDITKRKKTEEKITELHEVRNKFISIISHQLRTPLTAVNWNLEAILEGKFGKLGKTQFEFLQATHLASKKITSRIHNLLTAIDVEEGRISFETEEIDPNNICMAVINESQNECKMRNLSCLYTPPTNNLPVVQGDGQKIRMVISTLLENAIVYSKDEGKINIGFHLKDNAIRFEITDTGVGIPQTEQHRIFTRFFRASNASIMQPDAFGLGLYVAKNFIEQHHGKIGFESKEGKGSMFWFELPIKM